MIRCPDCDTSSNQKASCRKRLQYHPNSSLPNKKPKYAASATSSDRWCETCKIYVPQSSYNGHLRTLQHKQNCCSPLEEGIGFLSSAFASRIASFRITSAKYLLSYNDFFTDVLDKCVRVIRNQIHLHDTLKINLEVFGRYVHETKHLVEIKSFNTNNKVVTRSIDLPNLLQNFFKILEAKASEFQERESGWILERVLFLEINFNKYNPLRASSYIPLPKQILFKKAVVNVRNDDHACFAWAITSALYPAQANPQRTTSYPHYSRTLDYDGIQFPMKLTDIPKFESKNHCSVNVYGTESVLKDGKWTWEIVGPLYYSPIKRRLHFNLLLLDDDLGNNHYCWIKDMSRLLSQQLSKTGHRKFLCDGCLQYFSTLPHLHRHQQHDCNHVYTSLPNGDFKMDKMGRFVPNHILKFENYQKRIKVPFVVYADFETVLRPIHTCFHDPNKTATTSTHKHQPHSFAYLMKCSFDDSLSKFRSYRGPDCANQFVTTLDRDVSDIYHRYLKIVSPMIPLTDEEIRLFSDATSCNICEEPFLDDDVKVHDHCHLTGKVRLGAAHSRCNLNYKLPNFVPVFFHNLSGYDCHLFLKEMAVNDVKFTVIAQNKEKYISFSKLLRVDTVQTETDDSTQNVFVKIRFLDSYRFMASSLDKLSDELDAHQCLQVKKYFPDPNHFQLMRRKGVFPYSYVDDVAKLDETTFPQKDDFFDKLTSLPVSDDDYKRAKTVWNTFSCSTLGEYSDIYLKTDVLLLADVFENFRQICLTTYDLDPAQYYTAPGLAWDSMLKFTRVSLQLLTDIDMLKFFQKGVRGGISQCVQRMHFANNPHIPDYNASAPTSYIMYLDATNLYGHSMSQALPISHFRWLTQAEIDELNVLSLHASSEYGYVLEVDVEYPQHLHDLHADLPFLVENIISPANVNGKVKKLIPNLMNKTKYVLHYLTLQQALHNGLRLLKVHRVIQFKQSHWLKPFIDLNTRQRNLSENKFGKSSFKLMNNSVFGKTMENVDKRVDVKLVTHWQNCGRFL
ncbi:uncharacterized protein LOC112904359, partial [Agrilus planipennis]|uniref:DNA-directed DNA polymerase n=1 Tax=Agrilus planipennis TaxID=224129 RepID=A0A7F5R362_AGRPL